MRTDIVDVYIVRQPEDSGHELLQLRRITPPLLGTWQPVIGHLHEGESAHDGALRELNEETGLLATGPRCLSFEPLAIVTPYFLAERNEIVMSARFWALATPNWEPKLNQEHDDHRWIELESAPERCHWPDQATSVREIIAAIDKDSN